MKEIRGALWKFIVLGAMALLLPTGCKEVPNVAYSGFLGDYSQMQNDPYRIDRDVYRTPADLKRYRRISFEPLVFYPNEESKKAGRTVDPEVRRRLVEEYNAALRQAFSNYQTVDAAGPGVLVIRSALTELRIKPAAETDLSVIDRIPLDLRASHMETEVIDGETNARLLAVVDSRRASQLQPVIGETRWEDVRRVFREWANALRDEVAR